MKNKTTTHGIYGILVAFALLATNPVRAEEKPVKPTPDAAREEKPNHVTAIGLWVDMGLGLLSEEAVKEKSKALGSALKIALKKETEAMTGDQHGVRFVTGKQFAAIVEAMSEVSSFCSFTIIGTTDERAYLEAEFHISSEFSYVAVVSAPRKEVPAAILTKLLEKQRSAR
jgi:hypothetical protein